MVVAMDRAAMLENLGLTNTEARVYLHVLEQPSLSAAEVADFAGISRSNAYVILRSLTEKGLVDAGAGYNSRYQPAPPERALDQLLERDRAVLAEREQRVRRVLPELTEVFDQRGPVDGELVEILRTPAVVSERFDRLQTEARETIDIVVRGPIEIGGPNQAEIDALRRGVRARAIYEEAALDHPAMGEHLGTWVGQGEEARVFRGALPMKFAVFDGQTVLMPLVAPGVSGVVVIIVRNAELGAALGYLFDTLWAQATPLDAVVLASNGEAR
jgi:sugar-specific transcriptional regulator TrmB